MQWPMKSPFCCVAALVLAASLSLSQAAEDASPTPTPKPSLVHRLLHPFEKKDAPKEAGAKGKRLRGLAATMTLEPEQVALSEVRTIKATLRLENHGKLTQLQFPTTQRVEAVIRDNLGKVIARWSEDQSFDPTPSFLTINPHETAEYSLTLPTRDLQAGELYSVEAGVIGYPDLTARKSISPTK